MEHYFPALQGSASSFALHSRENAMSQNLTQPEEIDRILREMARHDMKAGNPTSDDATASDNIRDAQRNRPVGVTGSSYNMATKKPMYGLPDP